MGFFRRAVHSVFHGLSFFHPRFSGRFRLAACLALCFATARCASGQAQSVQTLGNQVRTAVKDHSAAFVSTLPADQQIQISIMLPLRNQAALSALLQRLYDPTSPDYHHFLATQQFRDQFGPTQQDYDAVSSFARANGFQVSEAPANRMLVPVTASAAQINAAFSVQMSVYQHPTESRTFFSPDREPSLKLGVPIAHISGLDNYSVPKPHVVRKESGAQPQVSVNGSGPGGAYLSSDMRAAYYGGTTLDGAGQALGVLEFSGYTINDVNLTFSNASQTYNVPVNNVFVDGATLAYSAGDAEAEVVLDIVQAIGMAPGLSQVRVYVGNESAMPIDMLNSMASENIAKELSCSWSWVPNDITAEEQVFQEMAAQGQSFFTASGDEGAFDLALSKYVFPNEDPYVTVVGGTHLTTTGPGGNWSGEMVWNSDGAGSGGGISPDSLPIPSWQAGLANSANGGSVTLRNSPDVAMEADFDNYVCTSAKCYGDYAGTSFAAPRWAGFMALINQQAVEAGNAPSGGIGFINPQLYQIAQGANAAADLHDITSGNNLTRGQPVWFSAVAGYDLATGWGSANGQSLIDDLAGPQVPGFWLENSQSTVYVNPGSSNSATLKITAAGGFTGSVNLAITSALPAGVTAAFATNPATSSSQITLSATSSVPAQTVIVTVTGTSGSLTQSTSFSVVIAPPSFALANVPNIAMGAGATSTVTVTVNPLYGFNSSVALSVSGLPAGITGTFSPSSTGTTSTLTLTGDGTAAGGTSTIAISSGRLSI